MGEIRTHSISWSTVQRVTTELSPLLLKWKVKTYYLSTEQNATDPLVRARARSADRRRRLAFQRRTSFETSPGCPVRCLVRTHGPSWHLLPVLSSAWRRFLKKHVQSNHTMIKKSERHQLQLDKMINMINENNMQNTSNNNNNENNRHLYFGQKVQLTNYSISMRNNITE